MIKEFAFGTSNRHHFQDADDISKLATYWKKYYNTAEGKGTPLEFIEKYSVYAAGI